MELLTESHLPLKLVASGKVRDIYEVDDDHLLLIATDRVSAFDVVMNDAVRYKGAVLTALSAWWFSQFGNSIEHHMVSVRTDDIIAAAPALAPHRSTIVGRATLCRRGLIPSRWEALRNLGESSSPLPKGEDRR